MSGRLVTYAAAVVVATIVACGWDKPDPRTWQSTKDYPCGTEGVMCLGPDGGFEHTCCYQDENCIDPAKHDGFGCDNGRDYTPIPDDLMAPDAGREGARAFVVEPGHVYRPRFNELRP